MTKTLFVGRTAEGERVWVSIQLRPTNVAKEYQTVDHETIPSYTELSITGSVVWPRERSVSSCGQILDDVARVVDFRDSAFDDATVGALLLLWERWHLNGMRAWCSHMAGMLPEDRTYDARKHIECPETGYRYGSAWLVEPLPESIMTVVETMMALPAGKVPHYV